MPNKKNFYLTVYNHIKEHNKLPSGIPKQNLNYYLSRLKKEGLIERIGYGVWKAKEVKELPKDYQPSLNKGNIRSHALIITIKLPKIPKWNRENREKFLKRKNISYKPVGIKGLTQAINHKGHKVWIGDNSIVIYQPPTGGYYGNSAKNSRLKALRGLMVILHSIENLFSTSFKIGQNYKLKVCRNEFGKVKDELAQFYIKQGKRLNVVGKNGRWLLIDDSLNDGMGEIETVHRKTAVNDMDNIIVPFFNDLKEHYDETGETITIKKLLEMSLSMIKSQQQTMVIQEMNQEMLKKIIKRLEE